MTEQHQKAISITQEVLASLGIEATIEVIENDDNTSYLNIITENSSQIIGKNGERLQDLQYLINRILLKQDANNDRIKIDCDHYRKNFEDELIEDILCMVEKVKFMGSTMTTKPLNSYCRRLIHNLLKDDEAVTTSSIGSQTQRYKCIKIIKKIND